MADEQVSAYIDFNLPTFLTVGLIAAFWFIIIVGSWSVARRLIANNSTVSPQPLPLSQTGS